MRESSNSAPDPKYKFSLPTKAFFDSQLFLRMKSRTLRVFDPEDPHILGCVLDI